MIDASHLLARLVGFDTTSSKSNRGCIDFIRDYLDSHKIKSEIVASGDGLKACLIARLGPDEGRGLMLAGHSDTVPVDGQNWKSDPFTLSAREDRFYGRGSCDMKGFIACALATAAVFAAKPLKKPLHLAFTYNEEVDMEGAARLTDYLSAHGTHPEWTWIGEPTSLRIVDAHKGVAAFETKITGIAGHSGQPDHGLNAIELGVDFLAVLRAVAEAKKGQPWPQSRFSPAYTTFNLGTIKGGTAENIIAEHCDIVWQVRAHPGEDLDAVLAGIERQAVEKIHPRFATFAPDAHMKTCACFNIPPLRPSPGNPGQEILARLTGHTETEAVSFGTEAGFFQRLGGHAIVCGPGSIEQAHKADEYIEKSQMTACMKLLERVLYETAAS